MKDHVMPSRMSRKPRSAIEYKKLWDKFPGNISHSPLTPLHLHCKTPGTLMILIWKRRSTRRGSLTETARQRDLEKHQINNKSDREIETCPDIHLWGFKAWHTSSVWVRAEAASFVLRYMPVTSSNIMMIPARHNLPSFNPLSWPRCILCTSVR